MKFPAIAALLAAALTAPIGAQQRPTANTEVYLADMQVDVEPVLGRSAPLDISNSPGYDNQPSYTPDGLSILFTSNRAPDDKQSDIYRYDIQTKTLTQLTHTPESEYSPVVTPDGKTFSVIRVEADGTQRLWRFDLDGSNPRRVMTKVTGIGYQAWLDPTHVAVFIVGANGQPNTLQLADTTMDSAEIIDSNPGHGLALRPGALSPATPATLTYVCKTDPQHWVVKEFDLRTRKAVIIADAMAGSEDLAWDPLFRRPTEPATRLLMPSGSKIFAMSRSADGHSSEWKEAGDFASAGVTHITRIAIKPAVQTPVGLRFAFVAEPVAK